MGGGAESVQGILTGMVQHQDTSNGPKRIEITNCFGLPSLNNFKGPNGSAEYDEGFFIHSSYFFIFIFFKIT